MVDNSKQIKRSVLISNSNLLLMINLRRGRMEDKKITKQDVKTRMR